MQPKLLLSFCCAIFSVAAFAQFSYRNLEISPKTPSPGESIAIVYNPDATPLESETTVECTAYLFSDTRPPIAREVRLSKDKFTWKGTFATDSQTQSFVLVFFNENKRDDNNNHSYGLPLYDKSGKRLPGALGSLAAGLNTWSFNWGTERNDKLCLLLLSTEFQTYSPSKRQFAESYFEILARGNDSLLLKEELRQLSALADLNARELLALYRTYEKIDDTVKAAHYQALLRQTFPNSEQVAKLKLKDFYAEPDVEKKKILLQEIATAQPKFEALGSMYATVMNDYAEKKKWDIVTAMADTNAFPVEVAMRLNWIAGHIAKTGENLDLALSYAKRAMDFTKADMEQPQTAKEPLMTEKFWRKNRELRYATIATTYAWILYNQNRPTEALPHIKAAVAISLNSMERNERYTLILEKIGDKPALKSALEYFIKNGAANANMEAKLKSLYTTETGSDKGYSDYLASLKKTAREKQSVEMAKKMLNKPAPAFSLVDLEGKTVSLADLKGKVVVVDFWATWCGPCIESFPGMQKAVDHYKRDKNVQFLFVATREDPKEQKRKVVEFMNKKKYTFQVLLDSDSQVMKDFQVSGIPTKFVIDRSGNIRFRQVGHRPGSDSNAVEEDMSVMIDLAAQVN